MAHNAECLAKLMAFYLQEFGKVTLGRKLATVLLQVTDRRNDIVEVGLHDLRLERGQNQISCSAGATSGYEKGMERYQPIQPIYTFSSMVDNTS
jgi:hypothetical protein